ncbi:glyoxalase domain-containing protein 4 [Bombina bombina]|uniref:glyoxalase domain-containing protein 4 n=1 Tax=Bombina bombina TaxID=8345 RepID=UPI00235ADD94|nr:glyoxalase domain-containing protein 4 [Bombina bombina]
MGSRRALHYVLKVWDRPLTAKFYRELLGMKVLRHEEFEEGCKATCNGPYDGKWSKTMIGYGSEDGHFVIELTYNYGVGEYRLGNDFLGITLQSSQAVANARKLSWPLSEVASGLFEAVAPGGYKFYLEEKDQPKTDPVQKVTLAVSDLQQSIAYWSGLLGMKIYNKDEAKKNVLLGYADNQCKLELQDIGGPVDHGTAFGRIAFSCPKDELPNIEAQMIKEKQKILTPLVSLDTPGKATVQVVILADPDGHEICFVGDEAFRELSRADPNADKLINDAMAADKSEEWFAKHKMQKPSA